MTESDLEALALQRGGSVTRVRYPGPADEFPAKPSKYRAKRTGYNGVMYASKAEAERAKALDEYCMAGRHKGCFWTRQPVFHLGCWENKYVADFLVTNGLALDYEQKFRDVLVVDIHAEDVKGFETAKFKRDKKLWKKYGPFPLWIIKNGKVVELIVPESHPGKMNAFHGLETISPKSAE